MGFMECNPDCIINYCKWFFWQHAVLKESLFKLERLGNVTWVLSEWHE